MGHFEEFVHHAANLNEVADLYLTDGRRGVHEDAMRGGVAVKIQQPTGTRGLNVVAVETALGVRRGDLAFGGHRKAV